MTEAAQDESGESATIPPDVMEYLQRDVDIRMAELSRGSGFASACGSLVVIVRCCPLLWGCRTQEDLRTGMEELVRTDTDWQMFYQTRIASDKANAQQLCDVLPGAHERYRQFFSAFRGLQWKKDVTH